ncbi:MAG: hypothetical protein QF903_05015 [Planctomycetota bacterium]|nr:hypothetical protein [Planctomycetota bacterium]MDP6762316.1 hypothetical protein [Planctomycetota bacterium]MDP6988818.1 hypothetical protein [Planctomycetota bacterium]
MAPAVDRRRFLGSLLLPGLAAAVPRLLPAERRPVLAHPTTRGDAGRGAADRAPEVLVSPSVYSTPEEVDRLCEAVESTLTRGLPG